MTYLPFTLFGLYAQTVQSPTITNTTTETSIIGTGVGGLIVPANTFQVGSSYHGKIGGVISNQNNDTIIVRIKTGSTILASTGTITLSTATTQGWECELDFTIATIGATWNNMYKRKFCIQQKYGKFRGVCFSRCSNNRHNNSQHIRYYSRMGTGKKSG